MRFVFSVRIVEGLLFVLYDKMSLRLLQHQIFTITLLNGCHVMNNSMFDGTHATMTIIASCLHDNNDMFTQGPRGGRMFEDSWLLQLLKLSTLDIPHQRSHWSYAIFDPHGRQTTVLMVLLLVWGRFYVSPPPAKHVFLIFTKKTTIDFATIRR